MDRRSISLACAAAALAAPALPVSAAERGEPFRVSVSTAGLDLASPAGREALLVRVRRTAARTCAPRPFPAAYEATTLRACLATFERAASAAVERSR